MQNTEQFAIRLHNEYQPSWSLDTTVDIVWRLQTNCIDNATIRYWFAQSVESNGEDIPITIESLPNELDRTDWR